MATASSIGGAVVTGGAKRMGRAIALGLAKHGYDVAVHFHRSKTEAEDVVREIEALGRRAIAIKADLSKEAETSTLIARAAAVAPLRLLVNCASVFQTDDIDTMTRASYDAHMETNLRAPLKLIQDFARAASPGDNLVVNILDQRVLKPTPQFLTYTLSRMALYSLTRTLAQALGPSGIRVNAIGPGPTLRNARQSEADFRKQADATVLKRGSTPDDFVAAILYLAGARAVTGQMIAVDGGQHLIWETPDVLAKE